MASPVSCQGLLALCWIELRRRRHPHTPSETWHRFSERVKKPQLRLTSGENRRTDVREQTASSADALSSVPQGRELRNVDGIMTSLKIPSKVEAAWLWLPVFSRGKCPFLRSNLCSTNTGGQRWNCWETESYRKHTVFTGNVKDESNYLALFHAEK